MLARKCDRCGTYYEPYLDKKHHPAANGIMWMDRLGEDCYNQGPVDLCEDCMGKLHMWLKEGKDNALLVKRGKR